jgi:hypothetical protein
MEIKAAQQEVRSVFLGGSVGQAVSGGLWLLSAALATWVSVRYGIILLVLGGIFIFPLTQLALKLSGHSASLDKANPLKQLAMQVAFIVPFNLPVIGAAALYNINWFYPAFMVVVGTHYMPFIFLYGMRLYAVLAAILIGGGVAIGFILPHNFIAGGWITGVVLLVFAVVVSRRPVLDK